LPSTTGTIVLFRGAQLPVCARVHGSVRRGRIAAVSGGGHARLHATFDWSRARGTTGLQPRCRPRTLDLRMV
jgi:hypothetical protein